ncbi:MULTISPECIES: glycosyltransferase family 4 protein [Aequorivita]|uniref:Glycosyltransferase family 4 protein n=1 Tax=Aequorivita iocasae TaxID=2803865 RepID=A0ABX7DSI2_9FLAO|nr:MULTISPECIES: glycosyltransferase family 4 protein [Aequorivita]QQX76780.1 glycosyltransferase family 4 protein [Aequorivita iocasae]UCA56252.1 glycosyltransferase family 4 protein [Aequorivita sp. F7]
MQIGLVLSTTPSYSETFFRSKIKGLREQGMDVRLYCQSKKDDFNHCPVILSPKVSRNPLLQSWYFLKEFVLLLPHLPAIIRYINLERTEGTEFLQLLKKIYLNAHLLKANLDWLHFGFATMALGSETVAKAIGAKMAVSFRGFDIAVYPVKYPGCYTILWEYVDKIHTISNDLLVLAKKHGLPDGIPIEKITPAIDVNLFKPNSKIVNAEELVFVTTGRLHWKKGFVQTIEVLAILKAQGLKFTYKIIGEGPEYERIAFAAYQLGLKNEILFLGKLPHHQVKKELESTSIYIQYSIQEGFCNAVLEAQAMGKLCIVSNAEGLSENVLHEKTGWVVPKNNPQALAETIKKVLGLRSDERNTITQIAQKRVREEFNIEKQQKEFLDFYN